MSVYSSNYGLNDKYEYFEFELDSLDNSGSRTNGVSPLDWPVFQISGSVPLQNIAAIKILEAQIPFSWYVFNSGNNTFLFKEGVNSYGPVTLPIGNFTSLQIAVNLGTALTAASLIGATYTAAFNENTQKYSITASAGSTFTFQFGLPTNSGNVNPRLYIGFPGGETVSSGLVMQAPNVALVSGANYLYINSSKLGPLARLYLPDGAFNLGGGQTGPQLAKIPVNVDSGGVINWQDPDPQKWFDVKNLDNMERVDFYLSLGNTTTQTPLQLNGLSFSIKLGVMINSLTSTAQASTGKRIRTL